MKVILPHLKGLFTIFFPSLKSHILDRVRLSQGPIAPRVETPGDKIETQNFWVWGVYRLRPKSPHYYPKYKIWAIEKKLVNNPFKAFIYQPEAFKPPYTIQKQNLAFWMYGLKIATDVNFTENSFLRSFKLAYQSFHHNLPPSTANIEP